MNVNLLPCSLSSLSWQQHQRVSFGTDAELLLVPTAKQSHDNIATTRTATTTNPVADGDVIQFQQYLHNFTGHLIIVQQQQQQQQRRNKNSNNNNDNDNNTASSPLRPSDDTPPLFAQALDRSNNPTNYPSTALFVTSKQQQQQQQQPLTMASRLEQQQQQEEEEEGKRTDQQAIDSRSLHTISQETQQQAEQTQEGEGEGEGEENDTNSSSVTDLAAVVAAATKRNTKGLFGKWVNKSNDNNRNNNKDTGVQQEEGPRGHDALSHKDGDTNNGAAEDDRQDNSHKKFLLEHSLTEFLLLYSTKKQIPQHIRQKRAQQSLSLSLSDSGHVQDNPLYSWHATTPLHAICANPRATLAQFHAIFRQHAPAVAVRDALGRLPLHVLGDCEGRLATNKGKQLATTMAVALWQTYPQALVTKDHHGFLPFVSLIVEWVDWIYEAYDETTKRNKQKEQHSSSNTTKDLGARSAEIVTSLFATGSTQQERSSSKRRSMIFPKPEIWDEVEWCFEVLSTLLDELAGKSGNDDFLNNNNNNGLAPASSSERRTQADEMRRTVACHLVTILPDIIKCVLLIPTQNGDVRKRLLEMSIFRRILLCHECVGEWLTAMLRKQGDPSTRAVDFFQLVSDSKLQDFTGGFRPATVTDVQRFHREREQVFDAVNALESTMGSLVVLPNRETERAATTHIIWYIMEERLARPFVLGLVLMDLILHIALMLSFRSAARIPDRDMVPTKTVLVICTHYIIRKCCESFALFSVSPSVLRGYFTSVWTMFDILAIFLTMAAFIWTERHPGEARHGFNAFVMGLLWIKVLGLLKIVNKDMSSFILALLEILSDIKNFLLVLMVVIFMFGDMFHIAVSNKDDAQFCDQDGLEAPTEDFCNVNVVNSYLRVYAN